MDPETLQIVYERQARWFAGQRSRLLRQVDVRSKESVLDLGTGTGQVLAELRRRSDGLVCGLDADRSVISLARGTRVMGQATDLPFRDEAFDLVFTQMFFMWAGPLSGVLEEVSRVLVPMGHLVICAEPDHGGAIEHPPDLGVLAELGERLSASGADVHVGRKLGQELEQARFSVTCGTHPGRPLEAARGDQELAAPEIVTLPEDIAFFHVPYFWFLARKLPR